jgi:DNA-binding SARP family transcriptional activator
MTPGSTQRRSDRTQVSVRLVGGFAALRGGREVALAPGSQRLVAFLALHARRRPLLRSHVGAVLWPDATEDRAARRLRTALWRLRQAGLDVVVATPTHLGLSRAVAVDVDAVRAAAHGLVEGSAGAEAGPLVAAGELLPDWYDDWLAVECERFRQLRLHALEALCDRLVADGRHAHAVEAGLAAVQIDPLRESAHRAVMRAHAAEGNVVEAIREFERFSALLKRCVGIEPSPAMLRAATELAGDGAVTAS